MSAVTFLTGLVVAVGVVGTVLPILPGLWLIWGACLVFGLLEGFGVAGLVAMAIITVLAAAGTAAGVVLPQRSASAIGMSVRDQLVALAFGIAGFFAIPVVGAVVGFVTGVFVVASLKTRDLRAASSWTWASLKSFGVVAAAQFGAGLLMAVVWVGWVIA